MSTVQKEINVQAFIWYSGHVAKKDYRISWPYGLWPFDAMALWPYLSSWRCSELAKHCGRSSLACETVSCLARSFYNLFCPALSVQTLQ